MKEEFLHYIWKYGLFDKSKLVDNEGNTITVIHPGDYNRDSGPDFFNARIITGGIEWAGNIEVHIKASDFEVHQHNTDPAYNNLILHLVNENDRPVFNMRGEAVPTARMIFDTSVYNSYIDLINNPTVIACQDEIVNVDSYFINHWLSVLNLERMQGKSEKVLGILAATSNDWDETLYRLIARYFGFRVNREPFEMLAAALPYRIIRKHADNILQVEALLFGTAGLLEESLFPEAVKDEYFRLLFREYKVLASKYSLKPLHGWIWKFSRLRPANFPTVRLSQLSSLLSCSGGIFSRIREASGTDELKSIFMTSVSDYWKEHFSFGRKSINMCKNTGDQAADILIINAVVPALFTYGIFTGSEETRENAISLLEDLPSEHNRIIGEWQQAGVNSGSAFTSQALLQLRDFYCTRRRCLACMIGLRVLSKGKKLKNEKDLLLENYP